MSKKLKKRVRLALHHLRQAHHLLGGISLTDGLPALEAARVAYIGNEQVMDAAQKMLPLPPNP